MQIAGEKVNISIGFPKEKNPANLLNFQVFYNYALAKIQLDFFL